MIDQANSAARARMVHTQLAARGIHDARVLAAMQEVPRHLFMPTDARASAHADCAVPIGMGQTISQPYMVAIACQDAALEGHERVLEVGAGLGYHAAVLGCLARDVTAVERIAELASQARANLDAAGVTNVTVVQGDGSLGLPEEAPFDAIVVSAAAPKVPAALLDQLAPGGRLVIPVGSRDRQDLLVVRNLPNGPERTRGSACAYVPLLGAQGWPPAV